VKKDKPKKGSMDSICDERITNRAEIYLNEWHLFSLLGKPEQRQARMKEIVQQVCQQLIFVGLMIHQLKFL
jgi:hypothetical protein